MKHNFLFFLLPLFLTNLSFTQTYIAKEQIEDAYLLKTGGEVFGNITAATSKVQAGTFSIEKDASFLEMNKASDVFIIRSNRDIMLDPTNNGTAGAVIVPATLMEFPDFLGDKIRFFSHTYKIGVSSNDLDITSDRNIKFHTDTTEDLMIISGDQGDVHIKQDLSTGRNIQTGNLYSFVTESEGDKILLFGTLYRIAISYESFDLFTDRHFTWHSDSNSNAMTLDADTGVLSLTAPLQLSVHTSLPSGSLGQVIYFDHQSDDSQDGLYVYTSTGWTQL